MKLKPAKKIFFLVTVATLAFVGGALFSPSHASALFNYTDHLMDDSTMRANQTMTASQIQVFLQNQGSGLAVFTDIEDCGSPSGSHYSHYATYYHCGSRMSAAQIIWDAAQAYGINPQVLLATMQKEQSLITTPNPSASQLNYAMGYGCPDGGSCGYAGFFNQLDNASWQFRVNMELMSGNNYWGYGPASYPCNGPTRYYSQALKPGNDVTFINDYGTGYTHFVIPNASTASLYCYTPHVYPGSAQQYYSGSYWMVYYFNRWFVAYSWQWASQYAYTDSSKTTPVNLGALQPGNRVYVGFTAKNTGNQTWTNTGPNAIMVGTASPLERNSVFSPGSNWPSATRPAVLKESSVPPGSIGTFEYWLTIPYSPAIGGAFNERFNLLANGITWFNDVGLSYYINFPKPVFSWQWASQYAYTDASKTTAKSLNGILPGDRVYVGFTAKNTGNQTWTNSGANPIRVGTVNPRERTSLFVDNSWINNRRPAVMQESSVPPGSIGTFEYWLTIPNSPGGYNERFGLLAEGVVWLNDTGLSYGIGIAPKVFSWQWASQYAYTDASKTTAKSLNGILPGDRVYVGFTAKNTGNQTWTNSGANPIRVGTVNPRERTSLFVDNSWINNRRPAVMQESSVPPGSIGTFEYWLTIPNSPGGYNERFGLLAEGVVWLNDTGLSYGIHIP